MEEEQKETSKLQSENKQNMSLSPTIIGIVGVIIIAIVGILFLRSLQNKNSVSNDSIEKNIQQDEIAESTTQGNVEGITDVSSTNENIISVEGGSFYYKPNEIRVKKGEEVNITFTNAGGTHDFVIDEFNVKTKLTSSGETVEISFTPDDVGEYEFYCSVGNHRELGMKGKLIVE